MLASVFDYFASDPLRLLYVLGGSGGLWFWIDRWRSRVRIQARIIGRSFDPWQPESTLWTR